MFRALLKIVTTIAVIALVNPAQGQGADSNSSPPQIGRVPHPSSKEGGGTFHRVTGRSPTLCFAKVGAPAPAFAKEGARAAPGPLELPPGRPEIANDPYVKVPREKRRTSPAASPRGRNGAVSVQVNVEWIEGEPYNIVGDAANEPSIAVDPTNHNRMAIGWRQFDTISSDFRQAGWGYTTDAGQSWTFPGVIEPTVFRSDPVLDADTQGNFFYNSLTADESFSDYWCHVFKSTDGGATWDSGTYAYGGDKQWMVIDRTDGIGQNNIYANWTQYYSICSPGHFTRSYDGGQTYLACTQVAGNPNWGTMAVGPDGEVYVAGEGFIVAKSTNVQDPGQMTTWTDAAVGLGGSITYGGGPNPGGLLGQAWVAVDHSDGPSRGNVYLLCSVNPPGSDPLDVMFARSTDGGSTWSSPVRVNDDAAETNAWQWFGTMSVAPNGRIDVIWNDTRNDPLGGYISELHHACSEDAGVTWSENQALGPPFDPHVGWPVQEKMGDYYDMVSDDDGADLAYAATYNGEQDVYYLRITCEDVATCETTLGDIDGDNDVDGLDSQAFVNCHLDGDPAAPECVCADMNVDQVWDINDVELFVDCLLGDCP